LKVPRKDVEKGAESPMEVVLPVLTATCLLKHHAGTGAQVMHASLGLQLPHGLERTHSGAAPTCVQYIVEGGCRSIRPQFVALQPTAFQLPIHYTTHATNCGRLWAISANDTQARQVDAAGQLHSTAWLTLQGQLNSTAWLTLQGSFTLRPG